MRRANQGGRDGKSALPRLAIWGPALLLAVGLGPGGCDAEPREIRRRPNVLVVVADDVAQSDVAAVPTPHIDSLSASGVTYARAYADPVCSPSRRTLLFGKWWGGGSGLVCRNDPNPLAPSPDMYSLPKMMKSAGYATAIFGKWHLGNNPRGDWTLAPQAHGFDTWRAGMPSNVTRCGGTDYWSWMRVDDGKASLSREYNTIAIRDALLEWWAETEEPRFAYVAFQAPHIPLHLPPPELLGGAEVPALPTPRELYELMLVSLDHVLGEILREVERDDTVVVFLGDNGTPPEATRTDQSPRKVKTTTFEDGIHVPLVVSGPGLEGPRRHDGLVHTVDLMATLADLLDITIPDAAGLDSVSFALPRGASGDTAPRATRRDFVFSDYLPIRGGQAERDDAVVTQRYKLRRVGGPGGLEELFDRLRDPREERPVDLDASERQPLLRKLRAYRDGIGH